MKRIAALILFLCAPLTASAEPVFRVTIDEGLTDRSVSGRLVIYLVEQSSDVRDREPAEGPFFEDPQPMYGADIRGVAPGQGVILDQVEVRYPPMQSPLPQGRYRAQAVLDRSRSNSDWRREPGNLFGEPVSFEITRTKPNPMVHLRLTRAIGERELPSREGLEFVSVRSDLLSEFRETDVFLNAGVVRPIDEQPGRRYPVVYEVPGFGGDDLGAQHVARRLRHAEPDSPLGRLARSAFWVVLDPEGPNGHHLFADSTNNGPVGRALVEELLPVIDLSYPTIDADTARVLRGHSSGGWSVVWLAIHYPETFGAAWSSSPDPVDFRAFQAANIYEDDNLFGPLDTWGNRLDLVPSYTSLEGRPLMSIFDENRMEEVLGPRNSSGQQWDSWLAVFGPRVDDGLPADLYHPMTGEIDKEIAERFRRYDIADRLRQDRAGVGRILKERVRIVVGEKDNYDLDLAVARLQDELDSLLFDDPPGGRTGYVLIVPGADHNTIFGSRELRDFPRQMLEHLNDYGHIRGNE